MSTWQADVARARWRADLFDYAAAGLRSIGHLQDAAAKEAKAVVAREFADACERFEELRATARDTVAYLTAREEFIALRQRRRAAKGLTGNPLDGGGRVTTLDNFPEPSDDELLGGA